MFIFIFTYDSTSSIIYNITIIIIINNKIINNKYNNYNQLYNTLTINSVMNLFSYYIQLYI